MVDTEWAAVRTGDAAAAALSRLAAPCRVRRFRAGVKSGSGVELRGGGAF